MVRIGIIGGGPGGLITAHRIRQRLGKECTVTILEASDRPGGKLRTRVFDSAPVPYESGAAEVYDYRGVGTDPLHALIQELGLATRPMEGQTVVLDGSVLRTDGDIARHWGWPTLRAIRDFRARAAALLPLEHWHPGSWEFDRLHPWAGRSCDELLDTVSDPVARRYLRIAVHSDLATEPHLTNGLNGLKNFVMDVPGYIGCYAIEGGMSRLAEALVARLAGTEFVCGARAERVERDEEGSWCVRYIQGGTHRRRHFDAIVLALPAGLLGTLEFRGEPLAGAMRAHMARFDRPGHYLRVSLLFRRPFWRGRLRGSWFMVDAFGGACVYDESARYDSSGYGVLGFLLAGSHALAEMGTPDDLLVERVIESLPTPLRDEARACLLETRVHRWCGGVSAQPGGLPVADPVAAHRPDPRGLPGLFLVGDYLFDSTLNAVLRSAETATELMASDLRALGHPGTSARLLAVGGR